MPRYYGKKEAKGSMDRSSTMRDGGPHLKDYYSGLEARNRMESDDGGMIREDHRAIANLPQEVKIAPYAQPYDYMPEHLEDTIRGVDHQIGSLDDGKRDKSMMPKKV